MTQTQDDMRASNLIGPIIGHVGDGNFHVIVVLDPDDPADIARGEAFHARLVERALAHEGTCTGEHGVGYGKSRFLRAEHGVRISTELAGELEKLLGKGRAKLARV